MIPSLVLFLVGGGAGAFMAARHFLKRGLPGWIAVLHGVLGAAGFTLLLVFCTREPRFAPARYSVAILAVAIGLGCVNVVYHLRRVRHRSGFIVAHAVAALAGVGALANGAVVRAHAIAADAPPLATAPTATPTATTPMPVPNEEEPRRPKRQVGIGWTDLDIHFDAKSAAPTAASLASIAAIAEDLKVDSDVRLVEIQGHADERGEETTNVELTRARARNVLEALVARGVAASRLRAVGYGARCPADATCRRTDPPKACHDETAWRRDRRVTLVVVESSADHLTGTIACASSHGN